MVAVAARLNALSFMVTVIAVVFFVFGCFGYSDNGSTVEGVAWITTDFNSVFLYYGLRVLYETSDLFNGFSTTVKYSDCSDDGDCNACEIDGQATFAFLVIGTFLAVATNNFCFSNRLLKSRTMHIVTMLTAVGSCASGILALGIFMGDCFHHLDNASSSDLQWGLGAILILISTILMGLVAIVQAIGLYISVDVPMANNQF